MNINYAIFTLVCIHNFIVCMEPAPHQIVEKQGNIQLEKILHFNDVRHAFQHSNRESNTAFDYEVKSIQLNDDGTRVAMSLLEPFNTCKRALQVFDLSTDTRIFDAPIDLGVYELTTEFLSPDGTQVITSNPLETHLYDIPTNKKILQLIHWSGHNIPCLNYAKTSLAMAFHSYSGLAKDVTLTSYDAEGNEQSTVLKNALTGTSYNSLSIIDLKNNTMQSIKLDIIRSLCFDPSDSFLAVASHKKITVYETKNFACVFEIPYQNVVSSISFNYDGTLLAAISFDGVKVFNLNGEQIVHIPYNGAKSSICDKYLSTSFVNGDSIAICSTNNVEVFTLDGKCIFSLSKDGNTSINFDTLVGFSKNSPRIALAGGSIAKIITCLYNNPKS